MDADARPIRMWHDEEIETLQVSGAERVAAAKFEALDHVYSAKRIVTELKSPTTAAATPDSK